MLAFSAPETHSRDAHTYTPNSCLFTREATFRRNKRSSEGLADPTEHAYVCSHNACQAGFRKMVSGRLRGVTGGVSARNEEHFNFTVI